MEDLYSYLNIVHSQIHHYLKSYKVYYQARDSLIEYEEKLRVYNPYTLVIGSILAFIIIRWFLNKLIKLWCSISKILFDLDSIEKIKICFINFAMRFSFVRKKIEKQKKEIKEKACEKLKYSSFKKLEFRDKPQDYRQVVHKLSSM
jgi:hypothetical protein